MKKKSNIKYKQKILIIGFNRIGRLAFKQLFNTEEYDVVAIKDTTNPKMLIHLIQYDNAQGKYSLSKEFDYTDNTIMIDGKIIKIYQSEDINDILTCIKEDNIDIIVDCSNYFAKIPKNIIQKYLDVGVKTVITTNELGNIITIKNDDISKIKNITHISFCKYK